jgi:hypothetical protein
MYRKILQPLGVKIIDFETGIAGRFIHKITFILYPLLSQFIASVVIHVLEHVLCFIDPYFLV